MSEFNVSRLEFKRFVEQEPRKSLLEALEFATHIKFPMPEYYIAHRLFVGDWKVRGLELSANDREERRAKRELVHRRIGEQVAKHHGNEIIECIDA